MSHPIHWQLGSDASEAGLLFCRALERLAAQGNAQAPLSIALTGGQDATVFYAAWAAALENQFPAPLRDRLCSHTDYFWSDERLVPHTSPDSNYQLAAEHLFRHRAYMQLHPAPVAGPRKECAREYAETIRRLVAPGGGKKDAPRFDLVILGLGDDGHTASLFPHSDPYAEDALLVRAVDGTPAHPHDRLTFTPALINAAREVWFLVLSENKQFAVRSLYERQATPQEIPALVADPRQTAVTCFLDLSAAGPLATAMASRS